MIGGRISQILQKLNRYMKVPLNKFDLSVNHS